MIRLLRRRDFALLWSAALISRVGDWVLITALPFYVYAATGSALASGATFLAGNLPGIVVGPVAGVFVDRWDRKRTIVAAELLQGVCLLPLLLVHSSETLPIVYAVAAVEAIIAQFSGPAFQAAIPHVVPAEDLVSANSVLSMSDNSARLIGPSLAGVLMATVGLWGVVLIDAASFFVEGALLLLLAAPLGDQVRAPGAYPAAGVPGVGASARAVSQVETALSVVWREWLEGLRVVAGERWVMVLFAIPALSILGDGMFTALLAPFVQAVVGGTALVFGWILTVRGLGGVVGGIGLGVVGRRVRPSVLIGPCALVIGAIQILMVMLPSVATTTLTMAVGGVAAIGLFVNVSTLLQGGIPDRFRGRVFAAYGTCLSIAVVIGNVAGGVLGDLLGIRLMVGVGATLSVIAGLAAVTMLREDTARDAEEGRLRMSAASSPADRMPGGD